LLVFSLCLFSNSTLQ